MNPHELKTASRSATSPYHRRNGDEALAMSIRGDAAVVVGGVGRFDLGAGPVLLAVADGVGSVPGVTPPAQQALAAIRDVVRGSDVGEGVTDLLDRAFAAANRAVSPGQLPDEDLADLWSYGSTSTVAFVDGFDVWIAHLGDSRAYLVRRGRLFRLTHDHTLVELLVRAGQITPAEAATHQLKNVMLATLGSYLEVNPSLVRLDLRPGDRLILCTNGVSDVVPEAVLAAEVSEAADVEAACASVLGAVLGAGATDHATILVAEVTGTSDGEESEPTITVVRDVLAEQSDGVLNSMVPPPDGS